jgi:hypothetical protein
MNDGTGIIPPSSKRISPASALARYVMAASLARTADDGAAEPLF